jgi:hypothetical protein
MSKTTATRPLGDVMIHMRIPREIFLVIEPAARREGLRLPTWIRRICVLAARSAGLKEVSK